MYRSHIFLFSILLLFFSEPVLSPENFRNQPPVVPIEDGKYLSLIISHLNKRIDNGKDIYGKRNTDFWMASLNTETGAYPKNDKRPSDIPNRAYLYRPVDAPKGSTLYWDMPSIAAAYNISSITGDQKYANAASNYIKAFLKHCVAKNGIFLWGNHYYYDAFQDTTLVFGSSGDPVPVDFSTEDGSKHELRPLIPAWDALWEIDPEATEKEIRTASEGHLTDPATGEFNRHAQNKRGHAFLEAGGILVHMLAWLYDKTSDPSLIEMASSIAHYSFKHRGPATGLLENSPNKSRWDKYTSTTEVGFWARCILAASEYVEEDIRKDWIHMADEAVSAWIRYGYDPDKCQYYGMLSVATGDPVWKEDSYPYKPDDYAKIWEPLFPTHDYPMLMAESCLKLYQLTGKVEYKAACERWFKDIQNQLPARDGKGAYAEHYARAIHFLLGCSETFEDARYKLLAEKVATEAVDFLYAQDMFRSHPGEDRFDAVDGMGLLSLTLIWLETGEKPDMMGIFF